MDDKILLKLVGITYNQIESGVYALILQQADGTRRIPIIIGYAEAQAIECKLQEVITPRPLTHDLMVSVMESFGISLHEVYIHRLESGIFAADLVLSDSEGRRRVVDSRSSDAIALAIRVGAPIYTDAEVLRYAGFEPDDKRQRHSDTTTISTSAAPPRRPSPADPGSLAHLNDQQLNERLQQAIADERYEDAQRIKKELERRK